jgi:uncharacterized protein (TIGR03437 family)
LEAQAAYGYTFGDTYSAGSATYTDANTQTQYAVGAGGAIRIGLGIGPYLGITVALAAATFTAPGGAPYIFPNGVVNAASSAPFTAGISRGEVISIYGSGLAPGNQVTTSSSQFPTTLDGVQVMINGIAAPLYYVQPGQVAAIVPYEISETGAAGTAGAIATIQVINNGAPSNTVTEFVGLTTPGVFTYPTPGGLGDGAILHQDFSIVTESSPAALGETVQVYVTGLGDVSPGITDGAAGPGPPNLSQTTNTFTAYLTSLSTGVSAQGTVQYEGLAPTLAGKYQINVTIPTTGVSSGDNILEFAGPDSDTYEATIPIGTSSVTSAISPLESAAPGVGKRALSRHGHALRGGARSGPMRIDTK